MKRTCVIARYQEGLLAAVYEDDQPAALQMSPRRDSLVGNIYIGKVKNILSNINAAFVEIGDGQICYYEMKKKPALYTSQQRPGQLTAGDELVIQVEKDAVKTKAPVAKADFSLAGRYLVMAYGNPGIFFSQKISDTEWKEACRKRLLPLCPPDCCLIVRTNSRQAEERLLIQEASSLAEQMGMLIRQAVYKTCYTRLYQAPSPLMVMLRDLPSVDEIVTDSSTTAEMVKLSFPEYPVRFYEDDQLPLYKLYRLEHLTESCLAPRVWLKSGGYLVIEPTEAMTVIDVNSGKYTKKTSPDGTFLKMNMEAAAEIARQLRLRNLSGMILVDFIDLRKKEDQEALLQYMNQLLRLDPAGAEALDMTRLNLMEITRTRVYPPLHERMGRRLYWNHETAEKK